jgi:hypothetical protein
MKSTAAGGVKLTTPPSSAEVKNKWSCTSTAPVRHHGMCKDNFTSFTSLPIVCHDHSKPVNKSGSKRECEVGFNTKFKITFHTAGIMDIFPRCKDM